MRSYPTTIQVTPPLKPLYKVLDEQRTGGEWYISSSSNYIRANGVHGWNILTVEDQPPFKEANAQYTALAVNNLAGIAEALQDCLFGLEIAHKDNPNKGFELSISKAKEALSKIS